MSQKRWLGFLKDYDLTILHYLHKVDVRECLELKKGEYGELSYFLLRIDL